MKELNSLNDTLADQKQWHVIFVVEKLETHFGEIFRKGGRRSILGSILVTISSLFASGNFFLHNKS